MTRYLKSLAVMATIILVSGCASSIKSDVSSWHQLPPPNGERCVIVPKDEGKNGSIEFAHYAELVSQSLQQVGYRPAGAGNPAELIVRIDYSVSDGRSEVRSYGGGYGYYGYYGYSPWNNYYGLGSPYNHDVRTHAVFARHFSLEIAAANGDDENLFESKVISEGRSNRLQEVMPYLVEAMFTDFPGQSGVTRRVKLDAEKESSSPGS